MSAKVTTGSKQHTSGPFNPVAPHCPESPSSPYTAINNKRLCNDKIEQGETFYARITEDISRHLLSLDSLSAHEAWQTRITLGKERKPNKIKVRLVTLVEIRHCSILHQKYLFSRLPLISRYSHVSYSTLKDHQYYNVERGTDK